MDATVGLTHMRYAHPQEQHQADAIKRVEVFNAAKETPRLRRQRTGKSKIHETVPTISPTLPKNPATFLVKEIEGKPNQIN